MTRQIALTLDIAGEAQSQGLQGAEYANSSDGGFGLFFGNIMSAVMTLAAVLVFGFLIWGAIEWITSAGDSGKLEKARSRIGNAVIGLIILAAVTAIFLLLEGFLGIDVLTFN
ncbi:MAG: hypothetical protein UT13_C0001G0047 [Candidatus Pacebacteria bacterium GW2011_GWF2_38_9]|nr:MAG: hypothetical protein US01_C0001G0047 [candidate division TM6 bacterium GW2011_GWF2_28_16]KKQ08762.1 MAG: hypothetical protein US20_C0012G0004 [Candidatus Pacebacteria bacterium GW2011_GWF1_36_5]KKQ88401.1 MAG: hypothetical protein UT13_C0001G0047 [Candidatus Pacebacteria bacterium GW2011_GWF2_38_9]HAZ73018.1 hypothetical protein [Candidatus Paceibacterota bacterium]